MTGFPKIPDHHRPELLGRIEASEALRARAIDIARERLEAQAHENAEAGMQGHWSVLARHEPLVAAQPHLHDEHELLVCVSVHHVGRLESGDGHSEMYTAVFHPEDLLTVCGEELVEGLTGENVPEQ